MPEGQKTAGAVRVELPPPTLDHELSRLAGTCAGLLRASEAFLFELSGNEIQRFGRFDTDPRDRPTACFAAGRDYRQLLEVAFERGTAFVEPVTGEGEETVAALVVPNVQRSPAFSTELLGAVGLLLETAFEARRLRDDRVQLEHCVERSDFWLRQIAETGPNGIALVDPTGTIIELNSVAAAIFGEERVSAIGKELGRFVHTDDQEKLAEELGRRAAGDRKRRETELRIVRESGELRVLRVWLSTLMDADRVAGICITAQDVTDEQARDAQLRRAERFANIAPLLGGVCHELNNPLTSIKSFAELMLLDDRPEDDREALEIVRREAARAGRIVSDLRLVARKTKEDGASVTPLDLNELVRQCCDALRDEFRQEGIDVRMELASSLRAFNGVRPQLERVVEQLLTNAAEAVRHSDRPRRIKVQTYATETGTALRVSDSGPGIHPGDVDRIFDPFWTTRTTGEGTGLGLSLVHGIVAEHNGHVRVDAGWGSGAIFTVDFPAMGDVLSLQREPPVQTSARTALRVLIVDDEAPIRYSLGRYLGRRGHEVSEAEEGERALALIEQSNECPFDIIVADLRMPGLGGDELYARLRESGEGLEERLIFITGDADSPDVARLLSDAAVPVVLKPFELPEIALIIESQARTLPPLYHSIGA